MTPLPARPQHAGPVPAQQSLSEMVDRDRGRIRVIGHLTSQGADLISGTADSLRGSGHTRVVLDLQEVRSADDAGLDILLDLRSQFAADGGELLIEHLPQAG